MISIAIDKSSKKNFSLEKGRQTFNVRKVKGSAHRQKEDEIIKESPLQIYVSHGSTANRQRELLSVTMRTPGDDFNLVTGFLFAEQIIQSAPDIISMRFVGNNKEEDQEHSVLVELSPELKVNFSERKNFLTNSACGFCGRASFEIPSVHWSSIPLRGNKKIQVETLYQLPDLLTSSQGLFAETGGSHAVALLKSDGALLKIFEDVGRHNAMDKLIGFMLNQNSFPLRNHIALFSGRMSYELVQKSLAAGIPVICSIGAPTSLAIELAAEYDMTVIGFLKNDRMNIYCGEERIELE